MARNEIISAETGINGSEVGSHPDNKTIGMKLDIFNEKINIQINIEKDRARLADIVPLALSISTKINDLVIKNIQNNGQQIPCKKGCSACCKRCLVPLSVPEAFKLKDEVERAPTNLQNSINRNCIIASQHLLKQKSTKNFIGHLSDSNPENQVRLNNISDWYTSLNLACPFLHQDICTIYEQRPLSCREHFIIGSAGGCQNKDSSAKVVDMPVRMSNVLVQLASELEGTQEQAVILPLALLWCEDNRERAKKTWPFETMVRRFVEIIEEMATKNLTAGAV